MATDNYDVVIIGAGTAGLVLANRLTEDSSVNVLVLEAGEDLTADPRVLTPAIYPTLLGSDADWNTPTEPQTGLYDKTIAIPHGRAIGGSSAINGQAFIAPSKVGIDAWGSLGNPGWDWETLAPYFKKCHSLSTPAPGTTLHDHLRLEYIQDEVTGRDGPIHTSFPSDENDPFPKAWVATLEGLGHKATGDPFSGDMTGAYTNAATIHPETRQRSYAGSAYWAPAKDRTNLTVVTGAHVQKILLEGASPDSVASGVQYLLGGEVKTAKATSEVVLSAGAIHSPRLLELSGIGDRSLLESLDIPVVFDNKYVGENFQDHPMSGISFEVKEGFKTIDDLLRQDPESMKQAMEQYQTSQSGPLSTGGVFSYSFLPLQNPVPDSLESYAYPESDHHPIKAAQAEYYTSLLRNPKEASASFFAYAAQGEFSSGSGSSLMQASPQCGGYYSVAALLLQPLSRGSVHVRSAKPSDAPKVDPRYLTHPLDLEVFARHMCYISAIVSAEPLASILKPDGRRNKSAPKNIADLDSMKEYVKRTTQSGWHPSSTCSMMPLDKGGVVNERLVVHGTKNLRVVDASVFPLSPRANTMATVYAVAERAADLMKEDLKAKRGST